MVEDEGTILRILFFVTFIQVVGFGMVIPILPLLLTEPRSSFFLLPAKYAVSTGFILLGLLIAAYPVGQFIGTPLLGQLSDRYGRKPLLMLSVLGTVVANIVFGIAIITANIPLMFISRLVNGLTGGDISIMQATIADISPHKDKSRNFGMISAAFGLGFVIGPFLGGLLSTPQIIPFFSASTPFFAGAIVSGVAVILIHFKLRETSPLNADMRINWKQSVDNIFAAFRMPKRRALFTTSFLYYSGFTFLTSFISVFLIQRFRFDQFAIGNYFLYIGLLVIFTQIILVPRVYKRFTENQAMPITLLLTGCAILALYPQNALIPFLVVTAAFPIFNGLTQVSITTLISDTGERKDQGLILGINSSLRALATAIPSSIAGATAALFSPEAPILIAGGIITVTAIGYLLWREYVDIQR